MSKLKAVRKIFCVNVLIFEILAGQLLAEKNESAVEWARKGSDAYHRGNCLAAIEYYDEAIKLNENYAEAYDSRGLANLKLKQYKDAEKDFLKALELKTGNVAALVNLGNLEIRRENPEQAISYLSKAIEINPAVYQAYNNRGSAYMDIGEPSKAVKDFEQALVINPQHARAHNSFAFFLASYPSEEYRDGQKAVSKE